MLSAWEQVWTLQEKTFRRKRLDGVENGVWGFSPPSHSVD